MARCRIVHDPSTYKLLQSQSVLHVFLISLWTTPRVATPYHLHRRTLESPGFQAALFYDLNAVGYT